MPKIKTHSGAKKRFALTKNGKVKRAHAGRTARSSVPTPASGICSTATARPPS